MKALRIPDQELLEKPLEKRYDSYISYANKLRELFDEPGLLAMMCCGAIRSHRKNHNREGQSLPRTSYIFHQFKREEEISTLRQIYGRLFILVSIYSDKEIRIKSLTESIAEDHAVSRPEQSHESSARDLVKRDENEDFIQSGQRLQEAFPLADLFIDIDDEEASSKAIDRFLRAFFGGLNVSPTPDEFGMYLAKSASLRSMDLSRQVGAAIILGRDELVTVGCNKVPRAEGGQYWCIDSPDERDYSKGHDENDRMKRSILADLVRRLVSGKFVNTTQSVDELVDFILSDIAVPNSVMRQAELMDLLEFGRVIHAEMAALCDAAKQGKSVRGGTLYCTTFPCHICAKHIVAAGLRRVLFVEPYPKSYAEHLHSDSIVVRTGALPKDKVQFEPFIGISPFRFRELFERGKRKDRNGRVVNWSEETANPIVKYTVASYFANETATIAILQKKASSLKDRKLIEFGAITDVIGPLYGPAVPPN